MTLILGGASQDGFAHVSDRWLTRTDLRSPQDTDSNKTIVVVFYDFMMAIGYTGVAYLGPTPTDQAIAELIADVAFDDRFSHGGFDVKSPKMLDLWETVERVRGGLNHRLRGFPANLTRSFALDIVGLHWRRGSTVPFAWTISMQDGELRLARADLGRDSNRFALTAEGSGQPHVLRVWRELRAKEGAATDLRSLSYRLVEVLRAVSLKEGGTVGPDAMSVIGTIENARPQVAIELVLSSTDARAFDSTSGTRNPAGNSPWVLTPGSVMAPSLVLGDQLMTLRSDSGLEVGIRIKGGPLPPQLSGGKVYLAMRSQARLGPQGQPPTMDPRYAVTPKWMSHLDA